MVSIAGFCDGNPSAIGRFLAQRPSYAERVFVSWRQHAFLTATFKILRVRIIFKRIDVPFIGISSFFNIDSKNIFDFAFKEGKIDHDNLT